ncbi:hypothetical protein DID77_03085, partial [Candidatus Marinamargulisbacteria bacterium SCGC AG-439-L15]
MTKYYNSIGIIVVSLMTNLSAQPKLSMPDFVKQTLNTHPFMIEQKLSVDASKEAQKSTTGSQDWQLSASVYYDHEEPLQTSSFTSQSNDTIGTTAGLSKSIWRTGGEFGIYLTSNHLKRKFSTSSSLLGPDTFYSNQLNISYTQPLWQNLSGLITRTPYDLAELNLKTQTAQSEEKKEGFISTLINHYLDWYYLSEQKNISKKRVSLANKAFTQANRKYKANIVDKVDVLRAKDAVKTAEQQYLLARSQLEAKQAELIIISQDTSIENKAPSFNFYTTIDTQKNSTHNITSSRLLQLDQLKIDILNREFHSYNEQRKSQINLTLTGGLLSGDEEISDASKFDQQSNSVSVDYFLPLGSTEASAKAKQLHIEIKKAIQEKK